MLNGLSSYIYLMMAAFIFVQPVSAEELLQPIVKVRLKVDAQRLSVRGAQINELSDLTESVLQVGLPKRQVVSVAWNEGKPIWTLWSKGKSKTLIGKQLKLTPKGLNSFIHINSLLVPKTTFLVARPGNQIDVIAELPMEEYLLGVLPSEMPLAWPHEALKAQSVAARSYTLSVMEDRKDQHFHVESTIFDQVYSLKNQLSARPQLQAKLKQILEATSGQYLALEGGQVYRTFYHADSGGATEPSQLVKGFDYRGQPSFSVKSPHASGPHGLWKRVMSKYRLQALLQDYFETDEALKHIDIVTRSSSGRIQDLSIKMGDKAFPITGQDFRRAVGFVRIKSTNFELEEKGNYIVITGKGFGHGVGMCQWGAKFLAKRGLKYNDILAHYYPETRIQPTSYSTAGRN